MVKRFSATVLFATVIATLLTGLNPAAARQAETPAGPRILVLNSYHSGFAWSDEILRGIRETLAKSGSAPEVFVEFMDSKRFYDGPRGRYADRLVDLYFQKYAGMAFGVIISTDDNAFQFLRVHREALFGDTPVVFCGVNYFRSGMLAGKPGFTGVLEKVDHRANIELVLDLHPQVRRLVYVNDQTTSSQGNRKEVEALTADYADRVAFEFLGGERGLSLAELLDALRTLGDDAIVIYQDFFLDRLGVYRAPEEVMPQVAEASPVPVYVHADFYLELGCVGGKVVSGFQQGRRAAERALRILAGSSAGDIPVTDQGSNVYMFDGEQLDRFGISDSVLPAGSVVVNRPVTLYQSHKDLVWVISLVIVGMGTVIVLLAVNVAKRQKAEQDLRSSQERFRDLVEMLPEAVFEADSKINLTFANRKAIEMFGYGHADLDRGLNGLDMIAPEDRERATENISMRWKGREPGTVEYQALKKDGTTFPVLFHASTIRKHGKLLGLRGIIVDISEQKRAEEEKARIDDHFRQVQKVESIGRLAGGVAHDLNNLLAPIIGYGELLLDEFRAGDCRRESINEMLHAAFRARDLVRQLLAFSRKQTLAYKAVNLNNTMGGMEMLLRRTIREDIEIRIIPSPHIGTVMADAGQIERVILNLAVNAQDAMPEGGRLTLETAPAELDSAYAADHPGSVPGRYVLLAVSDTGCGMEEDTREHLFEPFFSTKGEQGTGLGLATVYGIVKQHGGNVWVYSEPGRGATFKIYLPVSGAAVAEEADEAEPVADRRGSETVLLVEDNEPVRRLARSVLERQGYKVLAAPNGDEALQILEAHNGDPVHLLLSDVIMPGMNARELYSRAVEKYPGLKVLYMSGYTTNVIARQGVLDDGVQFIQKPFTVQALSNKVREVLTRHAVNG